MELTNTATGPNAISRSEVYPIHKDYSTLLEQGYQLISAYSGSVWTNYNDSDPGITILQNLCYALTELGNKAELPICDLLTTENGKISLENQFHTPEQVFPINPVTTNDFCKLLLNELPELKQIYFKSGTLTSAIGCTLEIKPEYVSNINSDLQFSGRMEAQVKRLLKCYGNISQSFVKPSLLTPTLLILDGMLTIPKGIQIEKAIAGIIYALNNCLSPYPIYESYVALAEKGESLADLLNGPYLSGGYISCARIVRKRNKVKIQELNGCLSIECVDEAQLSKLSVDAHDVIPQQSIEISEDEAPYVSVDSLANTCIMQNGKPVKTFDRKKVNYYLTQQIPVQQPSDLKELIPHGVHRDIAAYYSIQNSFPSVYQLTGKGPTEPAHQAKVKQLKAYLFIFEQIMGDYLAQLSRVSQLFSFDSGRTNCQLASATYFNQPLYNVPGIDRVISKVTDSPYDQDYSMRASDWLSYQQNTQNPYVSLLNSKTVSTNENLSRKLRSMEHLLARYGKQYDHQPLRFANPKYGSDGIAEVEYLKQTLRTFPLLSSNPIRTYFKNDLYTGMRTGLALNVANDLDLQSFFQGVFQWIEQGFRQSNIIEIIYYDHAGKRELIFPRSDKDWANQLPANRCNWVEVFCGGERLLSFHSEEKLHAMTLTEAQTFLNRYTSPLNNLASKHSGLMVIDFARLMDFLSFRWTLRSADGATLYSSRMLSLDQVTKRLSFVESETALEIKEINPGVEYEVGAKTNQHRYIVCDHISSQNDAKLVLDRLNSLKSDYAGAITITVGDRSGNDLEELSSLVRCVFVLLPQWVSALQQDDYTQLVEGKVMSLSPPSVVTEVLFLTLEDVEEVMPLYEMWLNGLEQLYEGKKVSNDSIRAAWELTKFLTKQIEL